MSEKTNAKKLQKIVIFCDITKRLLHTAFVKKKFASAILGDVFWLPHCIEPYQCTTSRLAPWTRRSRTAAACLRPQSQTLLHCTIGSTSKKQLKKVHFGKIAICASFSAATQCFERKVRKDNQNNLCMRYATIWVRVLKI